MSVSVPSKYLDREDSLDYYGKDLPYPLQDDLTKGILDTVSMPPNESLDLAMKEQKLIQEGKKQRREDEGDFMYELNNFKRGQTLLKQSEKSARLYDSYKKRNYNPETRTKRLLPEDVNDLVNKVNIERNIGTGGRRTRKRVRKNKTKRRRRLHKINKKKRV
jgi:hypothetical protein